MPCCRNESSRGRDQPPRSDNPASRCFGATILPQGVYDEYVQRGESENRNKELKIDLCGERLSDHRFVANLFRLLMHATALNLIIRLRRELPDAPPEDRRCAPRRDAERPGPPTGAELRRAQPAT